MIRPPHTQRTQAHTPHTILGYDIEGQKLARRARGDKLDALLARNDGGAALRTIYDEYNDEEIVLSKVGAIKISNRNCTPKLNAAGCKRRLLQIVPLAIVPASMRPYAINTINPFIYPLNPPFKPSRRRLAC